MNLKVKRIECFDASMLSLVLLESRDEGYRFLDRLLEDYQNGVNRFDRPGEALFGVFDGTDLAAIGGLNQDPFSSDPAVGRVRRLYVRPLFRRQGVGRLLMNAILDEARTHFAILTLRTSTPSAALFYESLGMRRVTFMADTTHFLRLREEVCGRNYSIL